MESLVAVVLFFVAIALGVSAFLVISNRRQAKPYPIVTDVRVPPDVREAVRRQADAEAMRPRPRKGGLLRQPSVDEAATPFEPVEPVIPATVEPTGLAPARPADAPTAEAGVAPEAHRPLSPGSHVPLVDALVGLQLPCDLLFLSNVTAAPDVKEVMAFVTTGFEPDDVARRFADELERLGYELTPGAGDERLHASRADGEFLVTVHRRAGSVVRGKDRAFPTAPATGVIVEVSRS